MPSVRDLALAAAVAAMAAPAFAEGELERGFAGALHGCEEWVLNPKSWADGVAPFVSAVGLGQVMIPVDHVDDVALPPPDLRRANHYWRINSTKGAGYILVVSDELPMCHITGGGDADLQPSIETVLSSTEFTKRWERLQQNVRGDIVATTFRNREDPAFSMVISRAKAAGGRLDHVQVLATAIYRLRN